MGAFTIGGAMGKVMMEICRLKSDGRYRVLLYDTEGMLLTWVSPRYRFLWVARLLGPRDARRYLMAAYSIPELARSEILYIERKPL